jgi:membrane-associated phospholipid phosphatase
MTLVRRRVALGGTAVVVALALVAIVLTDEVVHHDALAGLDGTWRDWVLDQRTPVLTDVMIGASRFGSTPSLLAMAAAVAAWLAWRRRRAVSVLLLAATAGMFLGPLLKVVVGRRRPVTTDHLMLVDSWSYPSGHALNSMVVLGMLTVLAVRALTGALARATVLVAGVALVGAIGFSRVYLGVHWPSDVLAGWLIGLLWLTVCLTVAHLVREYRRVGYRSEE